MPQDLKSCVVSIRSTKNRGTIVGTGFVVDDQHILTCAHVTAEAGAAPGDEVTAVFAENDQKRQALVLTRPFQPTHLGDIALLQLQRPLPENVQPALLGLHQENAQPDFTSFGYVPLGNMKGIWASGTIQGETADTNNIPWLQLDSKQADKGLSGAPILDLATDRVVGMLSRIANKEKANRDTCFATPIAAIAKLWPDLPLHLSAVTPDTQPLVAIENYQHISLSPAETEILQTMFAAYQRISLKSEFGGGFGGGKVLLLRPIRDSGAELPVVVKLGPIDIIQQEWDAFQAFVARKVPKVARIDGEMVRSRDGSEAGIRYPLAGDGRFHTDSLATFLTQPTEAITYVLKSQLFASIGAMWQDNTLYPEAYVAGSFDPILPANLFIQYSSVSSVDPVHLTPQTIHQTQAYRGLDVTLSDFVVSEVDIKNEELTLNLPTQEHPLPTGYRIRITGVSDPTPFTAGKPLTTRLNGTVQATRHTYLQQIVARCFTGQLDANADPFTLSNLDPLPNPLAALPNLLNQTRDVRLGPIHGDLNLQNILVEYDQQNRSVILIDFANARRDLVLHDLWRLETGIWLYLLPDLIHQHSLGLADVPALNRTVHTAVSTNTPTTPPAALDKPFHILTTIRRQANQYFAQGNRWTEYFHGLIPYLLGALKFKNLDKQPTAPLPKQIAFIAAASLLQISRERPSITPAATPAQTQTPTPTQPDTTPQQQSTPTSLPPAEQTRTTKLTTNRHDLYNVLVQHFSMPDIEEMCFLMNIEYEDIPGRSRSAKAREFVEFLERHGRVPELPALIRKMRPHINWQ